MACIGDSNVASAMGGVLSIVSTLLQPGTIASASLSGLLDETAIFFDILHIIILKNIAIVRSCGPMLLQMGKFCLQVAEVPPSLPQVLP